MLNEITCLIPLLAHLLAPSGTQQLYKNGWMLWNGYSIFFCFSFHIDTSISFQQVCNLTKISYHILLDKISKIRVKRIVIPTYVNNTNHFLTSVGDHWRRLNVPCGHFLTFLLDPGKFLALPPNYTEENGFLSSLQDQRTSWLEIETRTFIRL